MNSVYINKMRMLLRIMPVVMEEQCFAMHGGTAINLYAGNLLRLSVDIDLTYIPLEDRDSSIAHISEALQRISAKIQKVLKGVRIVPRLDISKLTCEYHGCQVKIEVNQTKRGIVGGEPIVMPIAERAQQMFELEAEARIVPLTQLYGGKIAAALSRQHPRDLFDVRHMTLPLAEAKYGLIFCLLGSDRPICESLAPTFINQSAAMENQFAGMTDVPFTYADFVDTRAKLVKNVRDCLSEADRHFLLSFEMGEPDWAAADYAEFEKYPSVQWKLLNLQRLKKNNPSKLLREATRLRQLLGQR